VLTRKNKKHLNQQKEKQKLKNDLMFKMVEQTNPNTAQQPPTAQYPQRQPQQQPQQYPQQQYPQQQPQVQPQPQQYPAQQEIPPRTPPGQSHTKAIIIGFIIVAIFAAAGLFILYMPLQEPELVPIVTEPAPTTFETDELAIDYFVFVSEMNEDFTFTENDERIYYTTQTVHLYIEPTGYELRRAGDVYKLNLIQDLEVRDPDGNIVDYASEEGITRITENPTEYVALTNWINFSPDAKEGIYSVKITLKDASTGQTTTVEDTFELKQAA
jgi:hypothetical protein